MKNHLLTFLGICFLLTNCTANSPSDKIVGTWKMNLAGTGVEGQMNCTQKYAADKSFLQTVESSMDGVNSTSTGTWHVDDKKLIVDIVSSTNKAEHGKVNFDIVQLGENSMTLKTNDRTIIFTKAQ